MKDCFKKIFFWIKINLILIILSLVALGSFLDFFSWLWQSKIFREQNGLQNLLLLFAFEAAVYYAFVTHKMWRVNKDPVLRLQWKKNIDKDFLTDIELINDGNGSTRDLVIDARYLSQNKVIPRLRNVTSIGPRGVTQLRYRDCAQNDRGRIFNNEMEAYKEPFEITIEYKDSQGVSRKINFVVDENYNDGFRIK